MDFPFQDVPGLLSTPELSENMQRQSILGAAQGLLQASDFSPTPKSIGGVAAGGIGGLLQGYKSGMGEAMTMQKTLQGQQSQAETLKALIASGVPEAVARSAALNPEVLKAIAPMIYQKPELKEGGTDPLTGDKSWVIWNPNTHQFMAAPPGAPGASPGGAVTALPGSPTNSKAMFEAIANHRAQNPDATPEELSKYIPNGYRNDVMSLITGKAIPANFGRSQVRGQLITLAHAIDDKFDETLIPQRIEYAREIGNTKNPSSHGGQIRSSGTIVEHLGDAHVTLPLLEAGAMGQSNLGAGIPNYLKAAYQKRVGGDPAKVLGHWDTVQKGLAGEMEKLLSGSHGAEASKQYWMDKLDVQKNGMDYVRGSLDEISNLMHGRVKNVALAKDRAFGGQTDFNSYFSDEQKNILRGIKEAGGIGVTGNKVVAQPGAPGVTPTNPQAVPAPQQGAWQPGMPIPPAAIARLQANPAFAPQFEATFKTPAAQYLGGQ